MKRASSSRASHLESSSECGDDRSDVDDSSFSSAECKPSYISKGSSSPAHNDGKEHSAKADDVVNDTTTSSSFPTPVPTVLKSADHNVDTGHTSAKLSDNNSTSHHRHKKKKRQEKPAVKDGKPHGLLQAKWDEMFNRLVAYKIKHGNCLVPNRYKGDSSLGAWVSTQRRQYKILTTGSYESTPMTPDRAQRLESLGFIWATKDPRHVPWDRRLQELVAFKKKYGHCSVPIGYERNVKLANWVSTQRQEAKLFREGRSSRLDTSKIASLESIGFIWKAHRGVSNHVNRISAQEEGCIPWDIHDCKQQQLENQAIGQMIPSLRYPRLHTTTTGGMDPTYSILRANNSAHGVNIPGSQDPLDGVGLPGWNSLDGQLRLQSALLLQQQSMAFGGRSDIMNSLSMLAALSSGGEDESSIFLQRSRLAALERNLISPALYQYPLIPQSAALSRGLVGASTAQTFAHTNLLLSILRNQDSRALSLNTLRPNRRPQPINDLAHLDPFLVASLMQQQYVHLPTSVNGSRTPGHVTRSAASIEADVEQILHPQQQQQQQQRRMATSRTSLLSTSSNDEHICDSFAAPQSGPTGNDDNVDKNRRL